MPAKSSTKTGKRANTASKARTLRRVVREQGRSYVWLAAKTGYSVEHIGKVARGDHDGTPAFHLAMERALGEQYDWPEGLERPELVS